MVVGDVQETIKQELARRQLARQNLLYYTQYTMPEFQPTRFHQVYYGVLNRFAHKQIKKLMVTVPPQHGKSEGSTRRLPSFMLGLDPHLKIAVISYAASKARQFNRDNQRIIDSPQYKVLFPETQLNSSNVVTVSSAYLRNSEEFQIVNCRGGLKAVGRGGPLTGDPVDLAVLDDLYKDYKEGSSPIIRQAVIDYYNSVLVKRLHNDSQQLIVFTRWDDNDLIGWLEKSSTVITVDRWDQIDDPDRDPDHWLKINFPALMNHAPTELDPREMNEPLYPEKHSRKKMEEERALDEQMFESMNQGNPKPKKGLLYSGFKTYTKIPPHFKLRRNYCDTADTGTDYLCSIVYGVSLDDYIYILDVIYTQEPQEVTEDLVAQQYLRERVKEAFIESNGGRAFARNVDRLSHRKCIITSFHQSNNKEARIISNSAEVQRRIMMPEHWASKWPKFAEAILYFKRNFRANSHDDAPDSLTGCLERSGIIDDNYRALYQK